MHGAAADGLFPSCRRARSANSGPSPFRGSVDLGGAKCVAVDSQRAFISSANFTLRAHDRNIETGVLVTDPHFAMLLDKQWMSLVPEHVLQWRRA
jgi:hypothetical protein